MSDRGDLIELLTLPRWRARWARLGPLSRDIIVILVVKFAALALLWWVFFSHPTATHMRVESSRAEAHLIPPASSQEYPRADR
jgi:alkylhydroperoxidase family enzyme